MWATLRPATFYVLATFSLIAWNVPHAQAQVVADPTAPLTGALDGVKSATAGVLARRRLDVVDELLNLSPTPSDPQRRQRRAAGQSPNAERGRCFAQ